MLSPLEELEARIPASISPRGELAEIFAFGSDFTDLQRQLKFKEIQGKTVEWSLPVYEVSQSGDAYKIQTSGRTKSGVAGESVTTTFLHISPRSDADRRFIERIKTGDQVKFKGVIADVSMRSLVIDPAIIVDDRLISWQLFNDVYGQYDSSLNCWRTEIAEAEKKEKFCVKSGGVTRIESNGSNFYHILALGNAVDDDGNPVRVTAVSGMAGVFVVESKNGKPVIMSGDSAIRMGSSGTPPDSWKLVQVGKDLWGWQTSSKFCRYGVCDENIYLFAPRGNEIRNLTDGEIGGSENNYGDESSAIYVELEADSSRGDAEVFPLLLTVSGEFNGVRTKTKKLVVPFDREIWGYKIPKNWEPTTEDLPSS